jgi:hypothetical protein
MLFVVPRLAWCQGCYTSHAAPSIVALLSDDRAALLKSRPYPRALFVMRACKYGMKGNRARRDLTWCSSHQFVWPCSPR